MGGLYVTGYFALLGSEGGGLGTDVLPIYDIGLEGHIEKGKGGGRGSWEVKEGMRWEGGGFWLAGWVVLELFVGRCVCVFVVIYSVQKIIERFVGGRVEQKAQKRMKEAPTTYLGVDEKRWGKNTGEIV